MKALVSLFAGVLCCSSFTEALQELPGVVLGIYQDVPSQSKNYDQFANLFELPSHVDLHKLRQIEFRKVNDIYYEKFIFWPEHHEIEVPFQLNRTAFYPVPGRNKTIEYSYNAEETADQKGAVLKSHFRDVAGGFEYAAEATFDRKGFHVKLSRDGIVAERVYPRTLPPYASGFFELDPKGLTPEVEAYFKSSDPLPEGFEYSNKIGVYFGPQFQSDKYLDQVIYHPTYYSATEFKFFEKTSSKSGNETTEEEYTIEESTADTTKVIAKYKYSNVSETCTHIFHRNGSGVSIVKIEGTDKEFTLPYNQVPPWGLLGDFEQDLSYPNATGEQEPTGKFEITRKGRQYIIKELVGDKIKEFPVELTGKVQSTTVDRKVVQYNVSMEFGSWYIVRLTGEGYTASMMATPKGVFTKIQAGNLIIRKAYARVMSPAVFGVFHSDNYDEDYKRFLRATGLPEPHSPRTELEYGKGDKMHEYFFKVALDNDTSMQVPFVLGQRTNTSTTEGKIENSFLYFEMEGVPTIRHFVRNPAAKGPASCFYVTKQFNAIGFRATYIYGGENCYGMKNVARRTFIRQGCGPLYGTYAIVVYYNKTTQPDPEQSFQLRSSTRPCR